MGEFEELLGRRSGSTSSISVEAAGAGEFLDILAVPHNSRPRRRSPRCRLPRDKEVIFDQHRVDQDAVVVLQLDEQVVAHAHQAEISLRLDPGAQRRGGQCPRRCRLRRSYRTPAELKPNSVVCRSRRGLAMLSLPKPPMENPPRRRRAGEPASKSSSRRSLSMLISVSPCGLAYAAPVPVYRGRRSRPRTRRGVVGGVDIRRRRR